MGTVKVSPKHLAAAIVGSAALLNVVFAGDIEEVERGERNFNAVQVVYQQGVPHTDTRGATLMKYDPKNSFFPIGAWGVPVPGQYWNSKVDWKILKDAGINTIWPWYTDPKAQLKAGAENNMKIVVMSPIGADVLQEIKDDPNLFANCWLDEPIGRLGSTDMEKLFGDFKSYREAVHKIAPNLPVFINDAPWIMDPATTWWVKWNTEGDISCHDNYPIMDGVARAKSIGADPNGIPQSVSLAVAANKERKPVWLIVGAFEAPGEYGQAFPFRYPTVEQLRACVYAGIIHGATGIVYFTPDNYCPRDGGVIGIAPDPLTAYVPVPKKEGYTHPTPATPAQLIKAKALWAMMAQINKEVTELAPSILSPTVGGNFKYTVDITGTAPTKMPIRCLLKPHPDGGYILLTVNLDDAVLKVTYKMPSSIKSAEVLFENRAPQNLCSDGKTFTLTYQPFDTHVVRITP